MSTNIAKFLIAIMLFIPVFVFFLFMLDKTSKAAINEVKRRR